MNIAFDWKDEHEGIGEIKLTFNGTDKYTYEYSDGDYCYSEMGTYNVSGNNLTIKMQMVEYVSILFQLLTAIN